MQRFHEMYNLSRKTDLLHYGLITHTCIALLNAYIYVCILDWPLTCSCSCINDKNGNTCTDQGKDGLDKASPLGVQIAL